MKRAHDDDEPTGKIVKKMKTDDAIGKLAAFLESATQRAQVTLFPFCFDLAAMFALLKVTQQEVKDSNCSPGVIASVPA